MPRVEEGEICEGKKKQKRAEGRCGRGIHHREGLDALGRIGEEERVPARPAAATVAKLKPNRHLTAKTSNLGARITRRGRVSDCERRVRLASETLLVV